MSQPHDSNTHLLHELQSEFTSLSARMQTGDARSAVASLVHVGTDLPYERPASLSTTPTITVVAGTNGAGKSSNFGTFIRRNGGDYFNPDEVAAALQKRNPHLTQEAANSLAWSAGKELLEAAIRDGTDYVFETTLGGNTIKRLLQTATEHGHRLMICYVGLDSADTHIQRVKDRVKRGGHGIPEAKIRERFIRSPQNLLDLLPVTDELLVFDNSQEADISAGEAPKPRLLLELKDSGSVNFNDTANLPEWASQILSTVRNTQIDQG